MPTLSHLQAKRTALTSQLDQHVGQINRINGAVAILDELIGEARAEEVEEQPFTVPHLTAEDVRSMRREWPTAAHGPEMLPVIHADSYHAPAEDAA